VVYVIPASELLDLLSAGSASSSARVHCAANTVEYRGRGRGSPLLGSRTVPTLHTVLTQIQLCIEPAGIALRSPATFADVRSDEYERWRLSLDRIQLAIGAIAEQRPGHMLYVGW